MARSLSSFAALTGLKIAHDYAENGSARQRDHFAINDQVICVVGMHRSGTSCLAGSLEQAGVYFGKVASQNPHNLKGNRENQEIVELHEKLLSLNQGTWDNPPASIEWDAECRAIRDDIICRYSRQAGQWCFKDPRTVLMISGWLEVLPRMQFIGTIRHPNAVARSLAVRKPMPRQKAIDLWVRYNSALADLVRSYTIPIINFDLPATTYQQKLTELFHKLGTPSIPANPCFFEEKLRHNIDDAAIDLPSEARELHEFLVSKAI